MLFQLMYETSESYLCYLVFSRTYPEIASLEGTTDKSMQILQKLYKEHVIRSICLKQGNSR